MLLWTKLNHLLMNKWFLPTQTAWQRHNYVRYWCVTWSHFFLKKVKWSVMHPCARLRITAFGFSLNSSGTQYSLKTYRVCYFCDAWKEKMWETLKKTEPKQHQGQPFSPLTLVEDSYSQRHLREYISGILLLIITLLQAGNHVNPDNEYSVSL